jgi:hypothetical protein
MEQENETTGEAQWTRAPTRRQTLFSNSQLDELLDETSGLMDMILQLDQATKNMRTATEAIAQTCSGLKPKHSEMARELDRLRRLHEVLSSYVFVRPESETIRENCHTASDCPSQY